MILLLSSGIGWPAWKEKRLTSVMEAALMVVLYMWSKSHAGVAYTGESSLADITLSMFYDRQYEWSTVPMWCETIIYYCIRSSIF